MDKNAIIGQIEETLEKYGIDCNRRGLQAIYSRWESQKQALVNILRKHPNWDEDCMAVCFDRDYLRELDERTFNDTYRLLMKIAIGRFNERQDIAFFKLDPVKLAKEFCYHTEMVKAWTAAPVPKERLHGTRTAYMRVADKNGDKWNLDSNIIAELQDENGNVLPFQRFPDEFIAALFVDEQMKAALAVAGVKVVVGQKTSRAMQRLFTHLGITNHPDYNTLFAKLGDSVSELNIRRHTCLSVHPCDYLLMSNGNSWQSCHMIDDGCYRGGTWSYMLDEVSAVLYTVDAAYDNADKRIWRQPKINRQVVAYEDMQIMHSRVYPDGSLADTGNDFRHMTQEIFADCLGLPNLWKKKTGDNGSLCPMITTNCGSMQYEDYVCDCPSYNMAVSVHAERDNENIQIHVGGHGVCPVCGDEYDEHEKMTCDCCRTVCYKCNNNIDEDDAYELPDGDYVCQRCYDRYYFTCDDCGEIHSLDDRITTANGGSICEDCYSDHYFTCTDCDEVCHSDDATYIERHGDVCPGCLSADYSPCENCGELINNEELDDDGLCSACHDEKENEVA